MYAIGASGDLVTIILQATQRLGYPSYGKWRSRHHHLMSNSEARIYPSWHTLNLLNNWISINTNQQILATFLKQSKVLNVVMVTTFIRY